MPLTNHGTNNIVEDLLKQAATMDRPLIVQWHPPSGADPDGYWIVWDDWGTACNEGESHRFSFHGEGKNGPSLPLVLMSLADPTDPGHESERGKHES